MNLLKNYSLIMICFCFISLATMGCEKDNVVENPPASTETPDNDEDNTTTTVDVEEYFNYTQYDVDEDVFIAEVTAENPTATWDASSNTLVFSGSDADGSNFMTYTVAGIEEMGEYYSTDLEGLMFGDINVLWCEEGHYGDIHDWCRSTVNLTTLDLDEGYVEGSFYCSTPDSNDDIYRLEGTFKIALD